MSDDRVTTQADVDRVRQMLADGHTQQDAVLATGLARTTVSRIASGWVPGQKAARNPSDLRGARARPVPKPVDSPLHCNGCGDIKRGRSYWGHLCQCGGTYRNRPGAK